MMLPALSAVRRWPAWWWLAGLAIVFLIRFPVHFAYSNPYLMDFEVYRAVAVRLAQGGGAALYTPATDVVMVFKYAPCWAIAWIPLAWLSSHTGSILWLTLTVLWLILACWGTLRLCERAGLPSPGWIAPLAVGVLVRPLTAEFLNGQVDVLWVLLVIAFLLDEGAGRTRRAAVWLSLAISLKLPAMIFLAALIVRGRWRLTAWVIGVSVALNLTACAILSPANPFALLDAWSQVLWSSGVARAFEIGNQSLFALAGRFLSADGYRLNLMALPPLSVTLVGLAALGLLFALSLTPQTIDRPQRLPIFDAALLTIVMTVGSPTVWVATYSALLFPVSLALAAIARRPSAIAGDAARLGAGLATLALSAMTHSSLWKTLGIRYVRGESYVFLVLMVLPWLALALFFFLWRQRSANLVLIVPEASGT